MSNIFPSEARPGSVNQCGTRCSKGTCREQGAVQFQRGEVVVNPPPQKRGQRYRQPAEYQRVLVRHDSRSADKFIEHRLAQQLGRQQSLGQDEIVEGQLVKRIA